MNAQTEARPEAASGSASTYSCTFGHYTQTTPWADVRTLPWSELAILLTGHEAGPKEGSCIVPATFSGTRRHKCPSENKLCRISHLPSAVAPECPRADHGHRWSVRAGSDRKVLKSCRLFPDGH